MNRLSDLRKELGITMKECAARLKMPYTTYVNYEKGTREPNSETLIALSDFFHVSIDYLLGKTAEIDTEYICNISDRIKNKREELGMSQQELADKMGYKSRSAINKIESGLRDINQSKIEAFAKALNTTPAYLMGWETEPAHKLPSNALPYEEPRYYAPVLGSVRAGVGGLAVQEVIGQEPIPEQYADDGEEYFWLIVEGDSMEPDIKPGDYVLVRSQKSVDTGTVAVVTVDGEEGVVKKVCYGDSWIELKSFNPYYPVRRFEGEEIQRIFIIGRVMESKRKY